jgi:tetratricopeptide (TPR) repeat protein
MDRARWERIQVLFHEAVARPESDRIPFLDAACGDDARLVADVVTMLKVDSAGESILDRGLPDLAIQFLATSVDSIPSREFGPYRLKRILGEGGMGVVWLAERSDAGNFVAIKFLLHAALSPARRERFAGEIRTLAKLKHPYIARLYDAGTLADGTPWFVMEYVEGVPLSNYYRDRASTIEDRLRLFRSVCEAVQYAHGQEIIHRDLKPSNIMVEKDGTPRLLDFGVARELQNADEHQSQTRPGLRFMSPDYAAPEWVGDGTVGLFTDVYSLGVILYEILTGRLPFEKSRPSRADGETSFTSEIPEKPSVGAHRMAVHQSIPLSRVPKAAWNDLDILCLKAMHREETERYQSVETLIRDIDHYLKGEPLEARPYSLRYRSSKFVRRNRLAVVTTTLCLALVTSLIVAFTLRLATARNTALAEAARTERIQQFMFNLFQGNDKEAGPAEDLRVVTLIDRGVPEAQSLGKEPDVQADLYQTLGTMYQRLGRLDRADTLLLSSLKERRSSSKPNNVAIADNLVALGLLRSDQGRPKEGEQLVREALAVIKARAPRNKSLLAKANFALGYVLVDGGSYQQAIEFLNQAISLQSPESGPSAELARTLRTLGDAHTYLGQYSISDSLNQRALAIDRQVYGDNHPQLSDDLSNLGQVQEFLGHYAEADHYERQALQITQAWYGKDHPGTAGKMAILGSTLMYERHYQEAATLLQNALAIQQRVYGTMHPHVAFVFNSMGNVAAMSGNYKDAETDFRRSAEIYRSAYGDGSERVATEMSNLASVYLKEKKYVSAEQIFKEVVLRFTKAFSADNLNTGIAQIKLGRTLLREQRFREAEEHTRSGYDILLKQTNPSTSFVLGAREDLAAIYTALKRPVEAQKFTDKPVGTNLPVAKGDHAN